MRDRLFRAARDIRSWILLFAVLRLIGITDPPVDVAHNWRQTTVLMVARNYHEQGIDLLHPRIEFAGEKSGITGMEFPLLNASVAAMAKVFGWQHWYGRLIVLLVSVLGTWCFHRYVRRYLGERMAFISALLLLGSLWFTYGRKTMPDVFALSLVCCGMWCLARWADGHRPLLHALVALGTIALGVLSKSPAVLLLPGLLPVLWQLRADRLKLFALLALVCIALLPALWWYGSWEPYLTEAFGFQHFFMGKDMASGAAELWAARGEVAAKLYFDPLCFTGFAAFLWGVVQVLRTRQVALGAVLLASSTGMVLLALKAGATFAGHSYYILPFVPVMAVVAAYGLLQLPGKHTATLLCSVVVLEGVANQQHDLFLRADQRRLMELEPAMDRVAERDALIVINSGNVPTAMYCAHRKGWLATHAELQRPAFRDSLYALGCRYAVVLERYCGTDDELPLPVLARTDDFRVQALVRP